MATGEYVPLYGHHDDVATVNSIFQFPEHHRCGSERLGTRLVGLCIATVKLCLYLILFLSLINHIKYSSFLMMEMACIPVVGTAGLVWGAS